MQGKTVHFKRQQLSDVAQRVACRHSLNPVHSHAAVMCVVGINY
jgi:hypothetical protein